MRLTTDDVNTHIVLPHTFHAVRVMNDRLSPVVFNIEVALISSRISGKTAEESGEMAGLGFRKIKTWLEMVLHEIIIINTASNLIDILSDETENLIMTTPSEPDDAILAALLLTKMQTIVRDLLIIDSITLVSSDTGYMKRIMKNEDIHLPGIEYLGIEAAHKEPWWLRETIETADFPRTDETDEYFAEFATRDPLKDLERDMLHNEEADVISIDAWKTDKPH